MVFLKFVKWAFTSSNSRWSTSKRKEVKLAEMHSYWLFNAMLKDLNESGLKPDEVIGDPYWQEVFFRLATAEKVE